MNVSSYIARRYLFYRRNNAFASFLKTLISNPFKVSSAFKLLNSLRSRDSRNVINIISGIAATGVGIGSLAMIVVLSAFNGLESLVSTLYTSVDPDIRISPIKGKVFSLDSIRYDQVATWPEVAGSAPVLEETVFLQYEDQQSIVTLRGIPENYLSFLKLDSHVFEGQLNLKIQGMQAAMVGYGIADNLNLFVEDRLPIKVYAAKRKRVNSLSPQNKFKMKRIVPAGIVALNPEFDYRYIYTDLAFAEDLLEYSSQASYIDVTLAPGVSVSDFKNRAASHFDNNVEIKSRLELNEVLFKTNATEKWVTFFILCFILIVATFNLVGSVTMLIIEKKKDIALLRSIGFSVKDVQQLFLFEGLYITLYGMLFGLGIGVSIILMQQYIGFFPLQGGIVEFYPVKLEILDLFSVIGVTLAIGLTASWLPVRIMLRHSKLQAVVTS